MILFLFKKKILITVSHYNKRDKTNLIHLTDKLKQQNCDLLIVINDDFCETEFLSTFNNVKCLRRPNSGMNIGSWNASYLNNRNYDFYLFLQDECKIMDCSFLSQYIFELSKQDIGMTGESINTKWNNTWEVISKSGLNYLIGHDRNQIPIYRVQYYCYLLKKWSIELGESGRHLRSLIWAFDNYTLEKICPFPIGRTKEECIASEIAVSKKVEQLGLKVTQIHKRPFKYISHIEWKLDGSSKL